ncbi:site-2 protease family protein [Erythrobacter sp. HKB08]|uniref:site-2 protease family protein n=1 Tax=Erythrobacter sp. HKB08 TaxID=2502843 RepID=UPI001008E35C|nr:site-2 protease family protein [Erythrobacter sp. HKB08]
MTEGLLLAAIVIPCLVIAIVFHEVAHGWTALALGDPTAKERNRLSFNPIRHVDPIGTLVVPGALWLFGGPIFGWAKPVPVIKQRLKNPRYGMMAVAAAGPGMNLLLALVGAILIGLIAPSVSPENFASPGILVEGLFYFLLINLFLAFFNLLPMPPFDGGHIVEGLLPRSLAKYWGQFQQVGMFLLVALIAASWAFPQWNIIGNTIGPPVEWALEKYLSIAAAVAGG